jgi:environmental stress-induced protein Ves
MRLLRAADRRAAPWKNGGGVTTEVAAWPPGASFDDFDWRVSMAEITADRAFSIFPGVDRVLAVLEGRFRLAVAGLEPAELTPASAPLKFPGDAPAFAELLTAKARDLNVMVRRGKVSAEVVRLGISGEHDLPLTSRQTLLFVAEGELAIADGALVLERWDAVLIQSPADAMLALAAGPAATTYCVTFPEI